MQLNKLFFQYAISPIPLLKDRTVNFSASYMLIHFYRRSANVDSTDGGTVVGNGEVEQKSCKPEILFLLTTKGFRVYLVSPFAPKTLKLHEISDKFTRRQTTGFTRKFLRSVVYQ